MGTCPAMMTALPTVHWGLAAPLANASMQAGIEPEPGQVEETLELHDRPGRSGPRGADARKDVVVDDLTALGARTPAFLLTCSTSGAQKLASSCRMLALPAEDGLHAGIKMRAVRIAENRYRRGLGVGQPHGMKRRRNGLPRVRKSELELQFPDPQSKFPRDRAPWRSDVAGIRRSPRPGRDGGTRGSGRARCSSITNSASARSAPPCG